MSTNAIVCYALSPIDFDLVRRIGHYSECEIVQAKEAKEVPKLMDERDPCAVMMSCPDEEQFRLLEQAIGDELGLFSDVINPNRYHFICSEDLQHLGYLFQSPIFGHYISSRYPDADIAARRYSRIVGATREDRVFGLEKLIGDASKVQTVKFEKSSQKHEGVEAVKNYLLAAKFKSRMATAIANAVDELLMNAMFDAPVDELGKHIHDATPRSTDLELKGKHGVELQVAFDGDTVGIMAADLFGSLDKLKLFSHISKRYLLEEYKVKTLSAGAGIGLSTIFRTGGSFFFASEAGGRTEVTVFFRRADNFRDFKDQFRFISTQFYY